MLFAIFHGCMCAYYTYSLHYDVQYIPYHGKAAHYAGRLKYLTFIDMVRIQNCLLFQCMQIMMDSLCKFSHFFIEYTCAYARWAYMHRVSDVT